MRENVTRLGKWSLLAAGVTVLAALCVAVILLASSRTEEAIHRLETHGDPLLSDLEHNLREEERDTFAGL